MPVTATPSSSGLAGRGPRPAGSDDWSDDRIARLKRLWTDEGLTARQIGLQLGVTRNAVLGKVHRLGLSNRRLVRTVRVARPKAAGPKRPAPQPRVARSRAPAPSAPVEPVGPGLIERLEDLGRHACHWPIGDPKAAGFAFCGRAVQLDPYCDAHRAIGYRPGGPKPVAAILKRYGAM